MEMDPKLTAIVEKYSWHPEFLGIEITHPDQPGAVDDTLLHLAARKGEIEDIKILIHLGGNVNAIGDLGYTPLHGAAMVGQLASIRQLLQFGADSQIKNEYNQTPLMVAEINGNKEACNILRRHMRK